MSVELKVTLVGDDPQQQDAFNNPRTVTEPPAQTPATQPLAPSQPNIAPAVPAIAPTAVPQPIDQIEPAITTTPVTQQPVPPAAVTTQPEPPVITDTRDSVDKSVPTPPPFKLPDGDVQAQQVDALLQLRLINTLDDLVDAIDKMTSGQGSDGKPVSPEQEPQHRQPQNMFERFAAKVDATLNKFGMEHSETGRHVHHLANFVADLGTRVQKFATATFGGDSAVSAGAGRAVTGAATAAASAASGSAAGAAGAGAAEGAAAAGMTSAAASLTGPLIAAGLVAGAFVFTLKKLVDSIESAANDLEDLSPGIAIGRAQHEMTMELKRLDRAKRIGDDVATVDHAMHRISESMYELQTKMYEILLKMTPFLESSLNQLNVGAAHANVMASALDKILAWFTKDKQDDIDAQNAAVKAADELLRARNMAAGHDPDAHKMFDEVLLGVLNMAGDGSPPVKPNRGNGH